MGDEKIFENIFKSNYNSIVGFCNQFISDTDKARSLAQEAFIKLWNGREKVETVNGIKSFLYTAAKTESLNYLRHEKVIRNYSTSILSARENNLNQETLESFNFDSLEFSELEELIKKTIEELPEKCKLVFIKSRFEGKKNQEIATELGIALKSVEANMTRALKILRNSLSDFLSVLFIFFL